MFMCMNIKNLVEDVRKIPTDMIAVNRLNRALGYWNDRHIPEAKQWFENTLQENSEIGEAHIYLGNIFVYKNKLAEAIEEYTKAERFDHLKQIAQINKVIVYTALKDFQIANKILKKLLDKYPDEPMVLIAAGSFNLRIGNYDASIMLFEKSIQSSFKKKGPYIDLLYLYETYLRNYDKAIEFANRSDLPAAVKEDFLFLNNLAYALIKKNKTEEAEKILSSIPVETKNFDFNILCAVLATKGLLNIYKGDLGEGNRLYNLAEKSATAEIKSIVEQKRLLENGNYYLQRNQLMDAEKMIKNALKVETSSDVLNYASEALEYLEMIYERNKTKEFKEPYIRCTNEGIAIDLPVNKIPIFLSFLNEVSSGNTVVVTLKKGDQYKILRFPQKKWNTESKNLFYSFLLSSTLIEWKDFNLYSGGDGYYFLELKQGQSNLKDKILVELKNRF